MTAITVNGDAGCRDVQDGWYMILSGDSEDRVLDINNWSQSNGGNLELYQKNNTTNQRFQMIYLNNGYYAIKALHSGRYLHVSTGVDVITNVHQWEGYEHINAQWALKPAGNDYYYLQNRGNGSYLDNADGSTRLGNNIQTHPFNGSNSQKRKFLSTSDGSDEKRSLADGWYEVQSGNNTSFVWDITLTADTNWGENNDANLQLYQRLGANNQKFYLKYLNNGYYAIMAGNSNKYLHKQYAGHADNVVQYTSYGEDAPQTLWAIAPVGNGFYSVRSKAGNYVDNCNQLAVNANNIITFTWNGTNAQLWKFVPTNLVPANVELVSATVNSDNIQVRWKTTKNASTYQVYRRDRRDGVWELLTETATGESYSDYTAKANVTYWYTVVGKNGSELSPRWDDNGVSATITLAPSNVELINATASGDIIQVRWRSVQNAISYQVYRRESRNGAWQLLTDYATGESYNDYTAKANVTYWYTVRAWNGSELSPGWDDNGVAACIEKNNGTRLIADGWYMIEIGNRADRVLEVADFSQSKGGAIQVGEKHNYVNQRFRVLYEGNGYYKISNWHSGMYLDKATNTNLATDGYAIQWPWNGKDNQLWALENAGGGYYYLRNKSGNYLDNPHAITTAGNKVITYAFNGSVAQKWKFVKTISPDDVVRVTDVSLNKNSVQLNVGETKQLTATVLPSNATTKSVTWSSNNTSVVTVDSTGIIKGIKGGNAIITVTTNDQKKTSTCEVTVVKNVEYYVSTTQGLALRKGAGNNYKTIITIPYSSKILVYSISNGWAKVKYNGYEGFCSSKYITTIKPDTSMMISLDVPAYRQYDYGDVYIGTKTIKQIGCTTCCLAMKYSYHTKTETAPDIMMGKLSYDNNNIKWDSVKKLGYTITGKYNTKMTNDIMKTIYTQLKKKKPVIIGGIPSEGSSNQHWIIVTGYKGTNTKEFNAADFTIIDPNKASRITLAAFLDYKPYVYRMVY